MNNILSAEHCEQWTKPSNLANSLPNLQGLLRVLKSPRFRATYCDLRELGQRTDRDLRRLKAI